MTEFDEPLFDFGIFPLSNEGPRVEIANPSDHCHTTLLPCLNCNGNEWDADEQRGDCVCLCCGFCDGGVLVHQPTSADFKSAAKSRTSVVQENARDAALGFGKGGTSLGAKSRSGRERPYRRTRYHRDLIRSWSHQDTPIGPDDWEFITRHWSYKEEKAGRSGHIPTEEELRISAGRTIPGCITPTKGDIRRLLRLCDESRLRQHSFVKTYLKKWMQIRRRLSGFSGTSRFSSDAFLHMLLEELPMVEGAFREVVQNRLKRRSFPHFNMMVHRLMELHGVEDMAEDFPEPVTDKALRKNYFYWWMICRHLGWPFLCNEAKIVRSVLRRYRKWKRYQ